MNKNKQNILWKTSLRIVFVFNINYFSNVHAFYD